MDLETALTRAGYILDRYRDQPPEVLRVINCYDVEAIAVLAGAFHVFGCHQADGPLCAGWAGCHDMAENLSIRLAATKLDIPALLAYVSPVPLFSSGAEAAAHGKRDIEHPSAAARAAIAKLVRVRSIRGRPVTDG